MHEENKPNSKIKILKRNNLLSCNEFSGFGINRNNVERSPTPIKKRETTNESQSAQNSEENSDKNSDKELLFYFQGTGPQNKITIKPKI